MTVRDLIVRGFKFVHILGQGESPTAEEAADALTTLNGIIDQVNLDRLLGYYQTEVVFSTQSSKSIYTIGPSSASPDVVAPRPVRVLSGFSRRQSVDLPMFIGTREDYNAIQMKTTTVAGWIQQAYYEATYPKGTLTINQVPVDTLTELHLVAMAELPTYATLDATVSLPPLYSTWLAYKLGQRSSPEYGMEFTPDMMGILGEVEMSLRRANLAPATVAMSGLSVLAGASGGNYNVYSDTTRSAG